MWVSLLVLEKLNILLNRCASVENCGFHIGHVLAESGVFVLDLVGQLTGVAHDQNRGFALNGLDLLQGSQDEDCCLTQTGLGLAQNVGTEDRLRNGVLLDCLFRAECQNWFRSIA